MFWEMTPPKQVSFIERVSKSVLGLKGLQIVVYCDRNRSGELTREQKQKCTFLKIGNTIINDIDGEYLKQKYGTKNGKEFGNRLHQERIKYLNNINKKIGGNK